ncbi:MAG TPA: DUF982 domain-containing protein [Pseudorhizobium sp.]|jgi:hypothetical protein|nr:DUF982 domain-containing protein [Pseudorhizobium sp.]
MNMMIRTSDIRWSSPVRVKIGYGFPEAIRGPREALNYLQFRWPAVDGENIRAARLACADAAQQLISPEVARGAFVKACIEARMLADLAA